MRRPHFWGADMDILERGADRLAQGLALIGAIGLAALLLHVAADVFTRNLLDRPIPATNEIASRYYMVALAFLPLAWVERRGGMVRVEILDSMASPWLMRVSEFFVSLLAAAVYFVLTYVTWADALKNWRTGTFVDVLGHQIAVWPTFFLPAAGFALAGIVTLLRTVAVLQGRA
jgi:TRAP-type C4-dicarboxylate transport system permease small subunit